MGLPDGTCDAAADPGSPICRRRIVSLQHREPLSREGRNLLVNGAPWPRLDVTTRKYRFRIVNGSNATPLRVALSSGDPLILIATDGGLLPAPVPCRDIPLAMAERVEVIVDFSRYAVGTNVVLQNLNTAGVSGAVSKEIMQCHVTKEVRDGRVLPARLADLQPPHATTRYALGNLSSRQGRPSVSSHSELASTDSRSIRVIRSWPPNTATWKYGASGIGSSWSSGPGPSGPRPFDHLHGVRTQWWASVAS